MSTTCPHCKAEYLPGDAFCPQCGSPITTSSPKDMTGFTCADCGSPLLPGDGFCAYCGSSQYKAAPQPSSPQSKPPPGAADNPKPKPEPAQSAYQAKSPGSTGGFASSTRPESQGASPTRYSAPPAPPPYPPRPYAEQPRSVQSPTIQMVRPTKHNSALTTLIVIGFLVGISGATVFLISHGAFHSGPTYPLASSLRIYQVGDSWTYNVSGTYTSRFGRTESVAGSMTQSIVTQPQNGNNYMAFAKTLIVNFTGRAGKFQASNIEVVWQDQSSHELGVIADNAGAGHEWRQVQNSPQLRLPGYWSPAAGFSHTLTYSSGQSETTSLALTGTKKVSTPLGTFNTWTTNYSSVDHGSNGSSETGVEDWAPQLGACVQETMAMTMEDGGRYDLTSILDNTTVPVQ